MRPRDLGVLAAGLAIGVVLAVLVSAGSDADPDATAPTTEETTTTEAVWSAPAEIRIGPAVVVATSLEMENGDAVLSYEVTGIAPAPPGEGGPSAEDALAAPARWTLIGPDFEIGAEAVAPSSRAVRFQVPAGFQPDAGTGIRLDAYLVPVPVSFPFEVDATSVAWYGIGPGLQARVVETIEQADNSIVIVEVDGPQSLTGWMTIDGLGREWVSSSRSMAGTHRWTLDYRGEELPDPLPLAARGVQWFEIETSHEIDVEPILP